MTIIEKLKIESLNLRKTKNPVAASITFAISEIENFGKNNGNRLTTEDEAIRVIQKIIATIDSNIEIAKKEGMASRLDHLKYEKHILTSVLPEMVSIDDAKEYLISVFLEKPTNKGIPMKALKEKFGSKLDMKSAGNMVSELYGF
jgi:uncharacterized protein YqeY